MKNIIWNYVSKLDLKKKHRYWLFIAINCVFYGLVGLAAWLLVGRQFLENRLDWALCFVGYPALLFGFFLGLQYIFKHE